MTTTVYGAILSPFVRKVLMTLELKSVPFEVEPVLPFRNDETYRQIHPLRKIPGFRDDQVTLGDSSVICDYLEQRYPQPSLYPRDPVLRARALWFEEYADTALQELLGPGLFFARIVSPAMFRKPVDEARVQGSIEALPAHLDYLEGEVPDSGLLLGDAPCIADLILPGVFLNGHYAGYDVSATRWPRFAAYLQRAWSHPLYLQRREQEQPLLAGLRERGRS